MNMRIAGVLGRHGATVFVLIALGAIGLWGHRSGWKAPKCSQLWGGSAAAEREDWCEAHNVVKSRCLACNPELGGADPKDWCREHGVPESQCTVCHPEILTQGQAADWCREHGVPESQCTLCHPEIAVKGPPPVSETGATVALEEGTRPSACRTHAVRVQFASAAAVRKAGVQLAAVEERPMAAVVSAAAEVDYDQTRIARLSTKAAGTVWRVEKNVGERVNRGDVLALVDAAEVGRAKGEFLQALAQADVKSRVFERLQTSAKEGYRTQAELQEAEAGVREARIRLFNAQQSLVNLGLPIRLEDTTGLSERELVDRLRFLGLPKAPLDEGTATANLIPVVAPLDGVVVAREIVAGEVVDIAKTLFVVADMSRMWLTFDVRQEDAEMVAPGQTVTFRPDGTREGSHTGKVSWISTAVDERTRTVRVRAEVDNAEGRLRAHMFGTGRIVVRESPNAVAVPNEAIHWEGCCHVVFVRLTDEIFQTRKVRLGAKSGPFTEIVVGVLPGEVVAAAGSHVLKSELLKSKLGAGCVDD